MSALPNLYMGGGKKLAEKAENKQNRLPFSNAVLH